MVSICIYNCFLLNNCFCNCKEVELLGGKDNILETEMEMSRFKVTLKDISKANKEGIIKLGAQGVVEIDDQLKIIFGPDAKQLKKYIRELK